AARGGGSRRPDPLGHFPAVVPRCGLAAPSDGPLELVAVAHHRLPERLSAFAAFTRQPASSLTNATRQPVPMYRLASVLEQRNQQGVGLLRRLSWGEDESPGDALPGERVPLLHLRGDGLQPR